MLLATLTLIDGDGFRWRYDEEFEPEEFEGGASKTGIDGLDCIGLGWCGEYIWAGEEFLFGDMRDTSFGEGASLCDGEAFIPETLECSIGVTGLCKYFLPPPSAL